VIIYITKMDTDNNNNNKNLIYLIHMSVYYIRSHGYSAKSTWATDLNDCATSVTLFRDIEFTNLPRPIFLHTLFFWGVACKDVNI